MAKTQYKIPYNKPFVAENTLAEIKALLEGGYALDGTGYYSQKCQKLLEDKYQVNKVLLTSSCTDALEMGVLLADIAPGDEVIMPSYTFVSTANAVILRGGVPVFVDIGEDDFNMDWRLIKKAVTPKTKVIMPVHYGGNPCNMKIIGEIAREYNLSVIEDAAQAINSFYRGRALGTFGNVGAISFHYTKNIQAGECGAIFINDAKLSERAEIILEKGTNRKLFQRGAVSKYSWVDIGSSYCPSEITAAFLYAQLKEIDAITQKRLTVWERYRQLFSVYETAGILKIPHGLPGTQANGHIFFVLMNTIRERDDFLQYLQNESIGAQTHFVPLHSSEYGVLHTKVVGSMEMTDRAYRCSLRLPIYDMTDDELNYVLATISAYLESNYHV